MIKQFVVNMNLNYNQFVSEHLMQMQHFEPFCFF